jgi:hypothetical protein
LKFPVGSIVAPREHKGEGSKRPTLYVVLEHLDQITTYFSLSTLDTSKQVTVIFENRHYLVSEAEAEE